MFNILLLVLFPSVLIILYSVVLNPLVLWSKTEKNTNTISPTENEKEKEREGERERSLTISLPTLFYPEVGEKGGCENR